MTRPVVIVDPLSSGVELAPAFRARGIPSIAVTLVNEEWPEFGSKMKSSDFIDIFPEQPGIESIIREFDPIGIIPGTEEGIPLAEKLTNALTPKLANDPHKSLHRRHKFLMQKALEDAGLPFLQTFHSASEKDAAAWLKDNLLEGRPLIVKPPMSSGSEMVFHIDVGVDWRMAFRHILTQRSVISGKPAETVVIQEQAVGTEYAVGTASCNGKHHLTHLIKYSKTACHGRKTIYDHVEFVGLDGEILRDLFEYTQKALDALGVRFGASHTEVMLTKHGPRLIESSPRTVSYTHLTLPTIYSV